MNGTNLSTTYDLSKHPNTLSGVFRIDSTYSDLQFHYSDSVELDNQLVKAYQNPGLTIGVLTRGTLEFYLDGKKFELQVPNNGRAICFAFNLSKKTKWERQLIKGNNVTKSVVTLPNSWLHRLPKDDSPLASTVTRLLSSHSNLFLTTASVEMTQMLGQFIENEKEKMSSMELESISLQFFIEGLKNLKNSISYVNKHSKVPSLISVLAMRTKLLLDECLNSPNPMSFPSLSVIARKLDSSVSTIQRQFIRSYGSTIVEHIRIKRLERAREKLEKGLNIGEVAYQSGYHHTSNFSSAFKKYFGRTPGEIISDCNVTR